MFVANKIEEATLLSHWETLVGSEKLEELKQSQGYAFYRLIFSQINEEDFACLYSTNILSSSNTPVNRLVGAMIIQHQRNWTHAELERQIKYNMEIRMSLGLFDFISKAFSMRTFYNFKNRLSAYYLATEINLFETAFDGLTVEQLKLFKVRTSIQRGDSVMLNSNIISYSRLSLLVEVLRRLYMILSEQDQEQYKVWFAPYLKGGEKYGYEVKSSENATHLEQLAFVYYSIYVSLKSNYGTHPVFQIFERAYQDHFKEVEEDEVTLIQVRPKEELNCHTLQSPDDEEATFKKKREETFQGYSAFGVETCHPDNELNLITHLSLEPNQTDDTVMLEQSWDGMMEKTPDLDEFHQDGGFGNEAVDTKAKKDGVVLIQTAVKGNVAKVPISIEGDEQSGFTATCPNPDQPTQAAIKLKKAYKVNFDLNKCEQCPLQAQCPTRREQNSKKGTATFRFKPEIVLRQKRHKAILKIPPERRTLRSGVENLMGLMHRCEKHTGKLKVRGLFNCTLYVFAMGIAINFERIFRFKGAF